MNAITPIPLPAANHDAAYSAACVVLADMRIGEAMDAIGDQIGALYATRRPLTAVEATAIARLRNCLVALSHARNLLAPLMTERAQ